MTGKRGIWTVWIVLLVAWLLGVATIPLLRVRRNREVTRTRLLLEQVGAALEQYRLRYGELPDTLLPIGEVRDSWGRPIQYSTYLIVSSGGKNVRDSGELWSLGPDPNDPSDDISLHASRVP